MEAGERYIAKDREDDSKNYTKKTINLGALPQKSDICHDSIPNKSTFTSVVKRKRQSFLVDVYKDMGDLDKRARSLCFYKAHSSGEVLRVVCV